MFYIYRCKRLAT